MLGPPGSQGVSLAYRGADPGRKSRAGKFTPALRLIFVIPVGLGLGLGSSCLRLEPTVGSKHGAGEESRDQARLRSRRKASLALTQRPGPPEHCVRGTDDKERTNVFTALLQRCQLAAFSGGTGA